MVGEADEDGSGEIEFPEFLKLMAAKLHDMDSVEEMQEAFSVFDRDKSGRVTPSELKHVMNSLGEKVGSGWLCRSRECRSDCNVKVTNEEVEEMIKEADIDGDGELSFQDFLQFVQLKGLNARRAFLEVDHGCCCWVLADSPGADACFTESVELWREA
ncbi:unnamed protein product [Effrenium voratum]|nr:unnamed protein product [Effrenium voratum]